MALQVNTSLITKSGFTVPSGSYVWVKEQRGTDRQYKIEADIAFYKDKTTFTEGKDRFFPSTLSNDKYHFEQILEPTVFAEITSMTVHEFVKIKLEEALNLQAGTIIIVG